MATKTSKRTVFPPSGFIRSSSDSVVVNKGRPGEDVTAVYTQDAEHAEPLNHDIQCEDVGVQTTAQGTLFVAARALPKSNPASSSTNKTRQQLQLPSFRSLGIAVPYPSSILTPPDEPTSLTWPHMDSHTSDSTPTFKSPNHPDQQASNTPLSPLPPGSIQETSNNTPTQSTIGAVVSSSLQSSNEASDDPTSLSTAPGMPSRTPWLEQALGAALPLVAAGDNAGDVVSVLYHPQPCPLSREVEEASMAETLTAKYGVISALQTRFEQFTATRYVEVTQLVPHEFKFSQLPSSPLATPNRPVAEANMSDYFSSPKTIIYTKGATVISHGEMRQNAGLHSNINGFPQTVVAPSSIMISILERFIPPATYQEYADLFKVTQPSALVDRMTELKAGNGALIFVYPTFQGAETFKKQHLDPILDPQLRTMNLAHGMPTHLIEDIGSLEAQKSMYRYEELKAKVSELVMRMSAKGDGNLHQFTVAAASKQTVHIGREALVEWYLAQEAPRIRGVINKFYGRTVLKVSQDGPPSDFTSAGFVGQIIDAVKNRPYDESPRDDIEVGVFVIKRSH
ncbi:MAG: hypothetical protein LQ352_002621 [Teloschistes flavicans]|nr:MAG: hypothetical protein LQ352_002621 [Teloschistes flavicans]